eukprot:gene8104-12565_t
MKRKAQPNTFCDECCSLLPQNIKNVIHPSQFINPDRASGTAYLQTTVGAEYKYGKYIQNMAISKTSLKRADCSCPMNGSCKHCYAVI